MFDILIVGCGLCGMVVARELAEKGNQVYIIERRDHIGGNIYDYYDENGILVQKYGPHVIFTDHDWIKAYLTKFLPMKYFYPECRTYINGMSLPMPFNFKSIDMVYGKERGRVLKQKLKETFFGKNMVSVTDLIESCEPEIHQYGMYMYEHEYSKYSAKQWGRPIEEMEPSVFNRVPVYISYDKPYLSKKYQYLPEGGFTELAKRILDHRNITVELCCDACHEIRQDKEKRKLFYKGKEVNFPLLVYTGRLDAFLNIVMGGFPIVLWNLYGKQLKDMILETPLSAFPEEEHYIRVTDYTQFPPQSLPGKAVIAVEFPMEYKEDGICGNEPYYPILTEGSKEMFRRYELLAKEYPNFYPCGRLADFKYYNMDAVMERAMEMADRISRKQGN